MTALFPFPSPLFTPSFLPSLPSSPCRVTALGQSFFMRQAPSSSPSFWATLHSHIVRVPTYVWFTAIALTVLGIVYFFRPEDDERTSHSQPDEGESVSSPPPDDSPPFPPAGGSQRRSVHFAPRERDISSNEEPPPESPHDEEGTPSIEELFTSDDGESPPSPVILRTSPPPGAPLASSRPNTGPLTPKREGRYQGTGFDGDDSPPSTPIYHGKGKTGW